MTRRVRTLTDLLDAQTENRLLAMRRGTLAALERCRQELSLVEYALATQERLGIHPPSDGNSDDDAPRRRCRDVV